MEPSETPTLKPRTFTADQIKVIRALSTIKYKSASAVLRHAKVTKWPRHLNTLTEWSREGEGVRLSDVGAAYRKTFPTH